MDAVLNKILTPAFADEILEELKTLFSDSETITQDLKRKRYELNETKRAINNLLELAETFGAKSAGEKLKQRETQKTILEAEIKSLVQRKNSEIEITPEALAVVVNTWRASIIQASESGDVLALRSMLARFITKIELDYHRAKIWYTFPIENNPIVEASSGGARINRLMAVLF